MVLFLTLSGLDVAFELFEERCEQGWTCKNDIEEVLSVGFENSFDSVGVRAFIVTIHVIWSSMHRLTETFLVFLTYVLLERSIIHVKAMGNFFLTKIKRNAAKTIDWKEFVWVKCFNNWTNIFDSLLILVVTYSVMKWVSEFGIQVWGSEVDGNVHGHWPSRANVVHKSWSMVNWQLIEMNSSFFTST